MNRYLALSLSILPLKTVFADFDGIELSNSVVNRPVQRVRYQPKVCRDCFFDTYGYRCDVYGSYVRYINGGTCSSCGQYTSWGCW